MTGRTISGEGIIGSSNVPGILGKSPYNSPSDEVGKIKHGWTSPPNEDTERGHLLEYPGLRWLRWHHSRPVRGEVASMTHPSLPWAVGTPDGFTEDEDGRDVDVDVKAPRSNRWHLYGDEDTDDLPRYEIIQMHWRFPITGCEVGWIVAYVRDTYRRYIIERNDALCGEIYDAVIEFRERYIIGDEDPPVDGSRGAQKLLNLSRNGKVYEKTMSADEVGNYIGERLGYIADRTAELECERKTLLQRAQIHYAGWRGIETAHGRIATISPKNKEAYPRFWRR